jgi:FRG domain
LRETEEITDWAGRRLKPGQITRGRGGEVTGLDPERMLAAFKRQARPYIDPMPINDFEWMFVAQHHGLPTRLLDWSTNALAALFFAVSGAPSRGGNGARACAKFVDGDEFSDDGFAIFVIDPGAVNEKIVDVRGPLDVAADPERWSAYLNPMDAPVAAYAPICVLAPHVSPRIRAQSGTFTLHGSNIDPIDYYSVLRPLIVKIFMPFTATDAVRRSLRMLGMTHGFIYPGLESTARDVVEAERLQHSVERLEWLATADDDD